MFVSDKRASLLQYGVNGDVKSFITLVPGVEETVLAFVIHDFRKKILSLVGGVEQLWDDWIGRTGRGGFL